MFRNRPTIALFPDTRPLVVVTKIVVNFFHKLISIGKRVDLFTGTIVPVQIIRSL